MNFGLSESQRILKENARKFFVNECPMAEVRRIMETEDAFDIGLYRKMAEQGFTGIIFPERYGGLGLGKVEMAVLLEEMGWALVPGPYFSSVLLAGTVIEAAASEAHKQKYLAPIAEGTVRATLAALESAGSWNLDSVSMKARGNVLHGEKLFVTDAAAADFLVVAARDGSEPVIVIVDAKAPGVKITPLPAIDLTRKLYSVEFHNAQGEVLASGNAAVTALDRALQIAEVGLAAELTGGMQRGMEITVEYAKTRKQFGKPIGTYQAVQHQCADMYVWTESSRSASLYAAWMLDSGEEGAATAVSVAKMYASDAAREIASRTIQVHGGMGFTWENDCHLYYRRAKASEVMLGDATFHRDRIAQQVVDAEPLLQNDVGDQLRLPEMAALVGGGQNKA
jgi:alkylation response protein AidB-like acyl-CoA dehydrogenase